MNTQDNIEFSMWKKIRNRVVEAEDDGELNNEYEEFSFLLGKSQLEAYSIKRAEDSLLKRKIHKSVIWYLLADEPDSAVRLYVDQKLYIEALVIAGLFELDAKSVYKAWASRLLATNKTEQAIKCYIAINDYKTALELVEKLNNSENVQNIKNLMNKQCLDL